MTDAYHSEWPAGAFAGRPLRADPRLGLAGLVLVDRQLEADDDRELRER